MLGEIVPGLSEEVAEDLIGAIQELLDEVYRTNPEIALLTHRAMLDSSVVEELFKKKADTVRLYTQKIERGGLN